jgi:hypothetical protein
VLRTLRNAEVNVIGFTERFARGVQDEIEQVSS